MFIQTEATPNPASLKFLPGRSVLGSGSANYTDAESARHASPLASSLFDIAGVEGVFFGGDFITVTKAEGRDWAILKPMILGAIMDHFLSGQPVLTAAQTAARAGEDVDSAIVAQIKELIATRVQPVVARDGGDITFHSFEDGIVYLHMRGACSGCPSATATLKNGIETMLRHFVPEIQSVQAI